jgi:hypothetical protein
MCKQEMANIQEISNALKQTGKGTNQPKQPEPNPTGSQQRPQQETARQAKFIPAMGEIRVPRPKLTPTATRQETAKGGDPDPNYEMGAGQSPLKKTHPVGLSDTASDTIV